MFSCLLLGILSLDNNFNITGNKNNNIIIPTTQLFLQPIIVNKLTNTTGNIASPIENPIIDKDKALPLFFPYHLPIATAGICISIP